MTAHPRYSMLDSMDLRCSRCGYENSPQFRFCGMCGAALRPPETDNEETDLMGQISQINKAAEQPKEPMPVEPLLAELEATQKFPAQTVTREENVEQPKSRAAPASPEPVSSPPDAYAPRSYASQSTSSAPSHDSYSPEPVHGERTPVVTGPSFLGLSDSGDRGAEYLLEDEPHPGRVRNALVTLLLLIIVGGSFFYWRRAGYPWLSRSNRQSASTAENAPAAGESESPSATNNESTPSATTTSPAKPEVAPTVTKDHPPASESKSTPAAEIPAPAAHSANPPPVNESKSNTTSDEDASADEDSASAAQPDSEAALTQPVAPRVKAGPTIPPPAVIPPRKTVPATPTVADPGQDSLYLEGQKYLYGGGGVAPNCARAQQYLMASANANNPKSQSTLATMYATGHCVGKNLPMAYHWFARALHADPRNTRLERDVEIMWNQMTPQEKQLAMKNQQ